MKWWKSIEKALDRLGIWVTGFTIVSAGFAWIAKHAKIFAPYGWAEAVISGFLLACVAFLVLSAVLVAWRKFRPIQDLNKEIDISSKIDAEVFKKNENSISLVRSELFEFGQSLGLLRIDVNNLKEEMGEVSGISERLNYIEIQTSHLDRRFIALGHLDFMKSTSSNIFDLSNELSSIPDNGFDMESWALWNASLKEWKVLISDWASVAGFYYKNLEVEINKIDSDDYAPKRWSFNKDLFLDEDGIHEYKKFRIVNRNFEDAKRIADRFLNRVIFEGQRVN